jgi:FkbM family methyltransferase
MIKYIRKKVTRYFPTLILIYRYTRDLLEQSRPPIRTPWGFTFVGHAAMAAGTFEPEETLVVRRLLAEVDILVNVGANVGYYCCHALSLGKSVIAIEPNIRNTHYLLRNIINNKWGKQVEVFQVATGCEADILSMWGGGTAASLVKGWASTPVNYVTQVPILTLDRILGDRLLGKRALIIVDIEGTEFLMLQGATKTLSNNPKPTWLIEVSSVEHQPMGIAINTHFAETFYTLFNNGYSAYTANLVANKISLKTIQSVMSGDVTLKNHNFIFVAQEHDVF